MIGAIAGDVIGSIYEWDNTKSTDFPLFGPGSRFTDDTVLTVALAEHLLTNEPYADLMRRYYRRYPGAGYGGRFHLWANAPAMGPYGSLGNGSAMRVSPVGFAFDTEAEVLERAAASAAVTHDHPEGIKGAESVALAIFRARTGASKDAIRDEIAVRFGYRLDIPLAEIAPTYAFDVTCPGSVPQAIRAFLESTDFEDAIRRAVALGGDSDTIACLAGGIAQAFYGGVPPAIDAEVRRRLDPPLLSIVERFERAFGPGVRPCRGGGVG